MKKQRFALLPVVALAVSWAPTLFAAEVNYELRGGLALSDNIRRAGANENDEAILHAGFSLQLAQLSKRIDLSVIADLDYQHYVDDTYDGEVVGAIDGNLRLAILPRSLDWVVQNRFGQLNTNPLGPNTAGNRENINSFSTGPDLNLKIGGVTTLRAGARYTDVGFEVRDTDSSAVGANLGLVRALSKNRTISLNATVDEIDYDNSLFNEDYDRRSVFAGFSSEVSKGRLSLRLGANEIDSGGETLDGTIAGITFSRAVSSSTTVQLSYDQRFSSAGDIFRRYENPGRGFEETRDIAGLGEPFENRRFSANVDFERGINQFYVSAIFSDDDYASANPFERRRVEGQFGLTRQLRRAWTLAADVRLSLLKYQNIDRNDDDINIGVRVSRQLNTTLFLDFGYRFFDRSSSGFLADHTENRISAAIRFVP